MPGRQFPDRGGALGSRILDHLCLVEDDGMPLLAAEDAAAGLMRRETGECVRQALDELDDESRLAVVMRYYDNAPAREIADLLGCSPAAVDMRLKRARDKLRERLSSLRSPEST